MIYLGSIKYSISAFSPSSLSVANTVINITPVLALCVRAGKRVTRGRERVRDSGRVTERERERVRDSGRVTEKARVRERERGEKVRNRERER